MLKFFLYTFLFICCLSLLLAFNHSTPAAIGLEEEVSVPASVEKVEVIQLQKNQFFKTITAYGEVVNRAQKQLSFALGGQVNQVKVVDGQYVKKGKLLMALNSQVQRNGHQQLLLQKEQGQLQLTQLLFERKNAKTELEKIQRLYQDGAATLEQKEAIDQQLNRFDNQILNAEKAIAAMDKKMESSDFQYDQFHLRAPVDGWVQEVLVKTAENVVAGQRVLLFTPQKQSATLQIQLSATQVAQLQRGQSAEIHLNIPQSVQLEGQVSSVARMPAPGRKDYTVLLDFDPSGVDLVFGVLAKAIIQTQQSSQGVLIPLEAIENTDGDSIGIWLLDQQQTIQYQKLRFEEMNVLSVLADGAIPDRIDLIVKKPLEARTNDRVAQVEYLNTSR
ncbi:MAG: efflux RND transporter periplasmic adaptor subunit [Bacteroidota bacterium]